MAVCIREVSSPLPKILPACLSCVVAHAGRDKVIIGWRVHAARLLVQVGRVGSDWGAHMKLRLCELIRVRLLRWWLLVNDGRLRI